VRFRAAIVDGRGEHRLERVAVKDLATGAVETRDVSALFVLIGALPHTEWLKGTVERDDHGFILTGPDLKSPERYQGLKRPPMRLETSMPGVFAAGDVRLGSVKRVASAAGEGAIAVKLLDDYFLAPVSL